VSPQTKEVTTLGRGGSDVTAVALAAHFKAERCEIRKDVDGIHSADPNAVQKTRHLAELSFEQLLDMTFWGAKVLHYRSAELAKVLGIPMLIGLAHGEGRHTLITSEDKMYEQARILSVNSHADVRWLLVVAKDLAAALNKVTASLKAAGIPMPQFLESEASEGVYAFLITAPRENLVALEQKSGTDWDISKISLATVTATCQGAYASTVPAKLATLLEKHQVPALKMMLGPMSVTVVVEAAHRDRVVQLLHDVKPEELSV
jgi:aspartate kinase